MWKNCKEFFPYVAEFRFNDFPAGQANITPVGLDVVNAINSIPQAGEYIHACHNVHLELAPEGIDTKFLAFARLACPLMK